MRLFLIKSWPFICLLAALVALFVPEVRASDRQIQSNVRVRVIKDADQIELKVRNLVIYDKVGTRLTLSKSKAWSTVTISKAETEGVPRVRVVSSFLKAPYSDADLSFPVDFYGSEISVDGKNLPSPVRISVIQGHMSGISTLKLSDYLLGVLHREMSGKWPGEALKAQAVATRSYSLAQMQARSNEVFDLEGSVLDQEFEWVPLNQRSKPEILNWQKALDETKDMILVGSNGETLKAFYHADCGGETTVPELVWGPKGEFQSVKDPACEKRKTNRWHLELPKSQIQRKIASEDMEPGRLKFDWVKSSFDKRVTWVEWTAGFTGTSQDSWQLLSGQNFRRLLGFDQLKSTRFQAKEKGDRIAFEGQGFGHGVGLCQWGSKDWAEKGWNVWKILSHYYPKAKIAFWQDAFLADLKSKSQKESRPLKVDEKSISKTSFELD